MINRKQGGVDGRRNAETLAAWVSTTSARAILKKKRVGFRRKMNRPVRQPTDSPSWPPGLNTKRTTRQSGEELALNLRQGSLHLHDVSGSTGGTLDNWKASTNGYSLNSEELHNRSDHLGKT